MTTAMALPLSLKRPAEDFPDSPPSPNTETVTQNSPVKLYNVPVSTESLISSGNGRAKRRKGDPLYLNNLGVFTDVDSESGESREDAENYPDLEFTNDYPKENKPVMSKEDSLAKEDFLNGTHPSMNGHRSFPCVWLDNTIPGRNSEGGDRSPNPYPQALPMEGATVPSEQVKPICTPRGPSPKQPTAAAAPTPVSRSGSANHKPNGISTPTGMHNRINQLIGVENGLSDDAESPTDSDGNSVEVCHECHKVFKRKVYLQRHMEREHWSTAKVFKCEDCSYETKHQSNLSVHRRTHTGERPYHCGACGQRYTQGHLLKSHIRSRHSGNMEFYNLEKKSESTRGRKSLDMKHEILLGGNAKQDKISALLQAVTSQSSQPPPPQLPLKPFGNLLSPTMSNMSMNNYMNSMSPFFSTLRPMMTPLGNSLLGPRFFTLGGMPNGMPNPVNQMLPSAMQQSLNMLNGQTLAASLAMSQQAQSPKKQEAQSPEQTSIEQNGIRIPLKIPEVQSPPSYKSSSPLPPTADQSEESSIPQDLTTKRPESRETSSIQRVAESLRLAAASRAAPVKAQTREEPEDLSSARHTPSTMFNPPEPLPAESVPLVSEVLPPSEVMLKLRPEHAHTAETSALAACNCNHLHQLKTLRKNVFRMLSVFTPDLSRDSSIDFETDEVDELLHEVIYSNIDDDCFKPKND